MLPIRMTLLSLLAGFIILALASPMPDLALATRDIDDCGETYGCPHEDGGYDSDCEDTDTQADPDHDESDNEEEFNDFDDSDNEEDLNDLDDFDNEDDEDNEDMGDDNIVHGGFDKSGDFTYYHPSAGISACGHAHSDDEWVLAVSHIIFDPHTPGGNPNNNALCGRNIKLNYNGNTYTLMVADRCEACASDDLDLSPAVFQLLEPLERGRIQGTWDWA
ncbi:hypothetical protein QBC47DRAFT_434716 [Echria macrotheca]|uniref:RlpA-like protein double-psi beta-barrel domain-containing protein n=1 Tax=Echria macrotheca TaxID=438768 RepID=A0AAJ0B682_9PEZI|nr:hypothetical protein QBC47DRAFT_434716 [Echria macrotheca]